MIVPQWFHARCNNNNDNNKYDNDNNNNNNDINNDNKTMYGRKFPGVQKSIKAEPCYVVYTKRCLWVMAFLS